MSRKTTPIRSTMPERARQPVEVARTLYVLETRRRNLQLKQQIAQAKLNRIENELAEIERQIVALGGLPAESLELTSASAAPPPVEDPSFTLDY